MPGDHLSFATMYGASADWNFATDENGIALFDGDTPKTGDVTADVYLWDAGTKLDEEPGVLGISPDPADTDMNVRKVPTSEYATPVAQHIRVTLSN